MGRKTTDFISFDTFIAEILNFGPVPSNTDAVTAADQYQQACMALMHQYAPVMTAYFLGEADGKTDRQIYPQIPRGNNLHKFYSLHTELAELIKGELLIEAKRGEHSALELDGRDTNKATVKSLHSWYSNRFMQSIPKHYYESQGINYGDIHFRNTDTSSPYASHDPEVAGQRSIRSLNETIAVLLHIIANNEKGTKHLKTDKGKLKSTDLARHVCSENSKFKLALVEQSTLTKYFQTALRTSYNGDSD